MPKLFNTIGIETSSFCNRKCWFCPNAYFDRGNRQYKYLDIKYIEKIANELNDLNYKGRIELDNYNEPLLDERLIDIIKLLRLRVPKSCIFLNTNGDYLTLDLELNLFKAGLTILGINIYDNEQRYQAMVELAKDVIIQNPKIEFIKNKYRYFSPKKPKISISRMFGEIKNRTNPFTDKLQNRIGLIPNLKINKKLPLNKVCVRPFRMMLIDYTGNAILCCNDYFGKIKFGNIKDKTLLEMWNNELLNLYRLHLQNGKRDLPPCDKCDFDGGAFSWNIPKLNEPLKQ